MELVLSSPPLIIGVAIAAGIGLVFGWMNYQRCPHCGHLVRRAGQGWRRCGACGRQYRRGLRIR
ncbi:MAG: hypothetical protein DME04_21695 [Candidatus Rokuibacteriota bacterium]|nr:MAG: hypothetical protein DME04_21695 [Candidatus Rokubacteria bacterium]